jgi:hypothetical protein
MTAEYSSVIVFAFTSDFYICSIIDVNCFAQSFICLIISSYRSFLSLLVLFKCCNVIIENEFVLVFIHSSNTITTRSSVSGYMQICRVTNGDLRGWGGVRWWNSIHLSFCLGRAYRFASLSSISFFTSSPFYIISTWTSASENTFFNYISCY